MSLSPLPRLAPLALTGALTGALLASGCGLLGSRDHDVDRESAASALQEAGGKLEAGELLPALSHLIAIRKVRGLAPEERARAEALLEQCVVRLLARPAEEAGPDELSDLFDLELPPRLRARAGVQAAERMLERGDRVRAYRMIRKVETSVPAHTERVRAGAVLARAGLSLARDGGRYALFFKYRTKGIEVLEYLVLTYPFDPRCAEAYRTLAAAYEERGDVRSAIGRHEDLMIYHPESPHAVESAARLPYLRMLFLERADYDRGDLLLARAELERWLSRHGSGEAQPGGPGSHELEPWVRATLASCLSNLAESDLRIARYYERIGNSFGARLHAERAVEVARSAGAEPQLEGARSLLERVPASEEGEPDRDRRAEEGGADGEDEVGEIGNELAEPDPREEP